jgi:hypothetical protein
MSALVRTVVVFAAVFAASALASAATPKEIDAAIKKGADYLKAKYSRVNGGLPPGVVGVADHGIGPTCLAGLAILEAGTPGNDPVVKTITEQVRSAAYSQTKTYQVALCLIYLDRFNDPADEPLIQALGVRLMAGQTPTGGWGYETISAVAQGDIERLKAMKAGQAGKLHPEVEKYAESLAAAGRPAGSTVGAGPGDNSNTQFAILAIWLVRKHGVPVDGTLDLIEKRFLSSQSQRTGGWGYMGPVAGGAPGGGEQMAMMSSPSMYCAGLLGLATAVARREERRAKAELKTEPPKTEPKSDPKADPKKNPDDPFFNPPPAKTGGSEPKKHPARQPDSRDLAVQAAFAGLGAQVSESAKAGRGALVIQSGKGHGHHDLYFLWSLERVGVIFGIDKIGGVDWYEAGAHSLVYSQNQDGSWSGGYGGEIDTSFAVLFLCKSNLARDLSGKIGKETTTEMKFGAGSGGNSGSGTDAKQNNPTATNPNTIEPPPFVPGPTGNEAATLAAELIKSSEKDWGTVLKKLRDTKGTVYTQALVGAVYRLEGDRRKAARDALAERLTRMTADTLRSMSKGEDIELRRGSVLAMAMKDDKAHIPDLVATLMDDEDLVVRAARAGLKSLAGEDFGPAPNATRGEKTLAVESWNQWMSKQKK